MFPRLCVHAANAWTGSATAWPDSKAALQHHLERLVAAGIEFRPLDGPLPWQRGGTGHRQHTSPLTIDLVVSMTEAMAAGAGEPDLEALARLLDNADRE